MKYSVSLQRPLGSHQVSFLRGDRTCMQLLFLQFHARPGRLGTCWRSSCRNENKILFAVQKSVFHAQACFCLWLVLFCQWLNVRYLKCYQIRCNSCNKLPQFNLHCQQMRSMHNAEKSASAKSPEWKSHFFSIVAMWMQKLAEATSITKRVYWPAIWCSEDVQKWLGAAWAAWAAWVKWVADLESLLETGKCACSCSIACTISQQLGSQLRLELMSSCSGTLRSFPRGKDLGVFCQNQTQVYAIWATIWATYQTSSWPNVAKQLTQEWQAFSFRQTCFTPSVSCCETRAQFKRICFKLYIYFSGWDSAYKTQDFCLLRINDFKRAGSEMYSVIVLGKIQCVHVWVLILVLRCPNVKFALHIERFFERTHSSLSVYVEIRTNTRYKCLISAESPVIHRWRASLSHAFKSWQR